MMRLFIILFLTTTQIIAAKTQAVSSCVKAEINFQSHFNKLEIKNGFMKTTV